MSKDRAYFVRLLAGFSASVIMIFTVWWVTPYLTEIDITDSAIIVLLISAVLIIYVSLGREPKLEKWFLAVMFGILAWILGLTLIYFLGIPNHPLIGTPF